MKTCEDEYELCPRCDGCSWKESVHGNQICQDCGYIHVTVEFDGDAAYHRLKEEGW